ncbi:MAG: transposase [Candidatus Eremiobacteraeota bacterium]|nr:transposase [Candidatus Eremiobacteraeota bacterium]
MLDHRCIEEKLFNQQKKTNPDKPYSTLYLYDVSSSYVEGECNEFAAFGYNRDGKKDKKQVVYGLLTDEYGDPISIKVFRGNTSDPKSVEAQIDKLKVRFACEHVALVGDKGMIRGPQTTAINKANLNYITGITKAEIRTLLKEEVL